MGLPFWWFEVPLTFGLVSGDVFKGLGTSCSVVVPAAGEATTGLGYEKICLWLLCGSECGPLDP